MRRVFYAAIVAICVSPLQAQECTLPEHIPPDTGHAALAKLVVDGVNEAEQTQLLLEELKVGLGIISTADSESQEYIEGLLAALKELAGLQEEKIILLKTQCVNALEMLDILVVEAGMEGT